MDLITSWSATAGNTPKIPPGPVSNVTCMIESCHIYEYFMFEIWISHVSHMATPLRYLQGLWVMSHVWLSHVSSMNISCLKYELVMCDIWATPFRRLQDLRVLSYVSLSQGTGWRRLIGSPKLQIISHNEPLNIGHFCGKWPIKIRDAMSLRHPVLCEDIGLCDQATPLRWQHLQDVVRRYIESWGGYD